MAAPYDWTTRSRQVGLYLLVALAVVFIFLVFMAGQFKGLNDPNAFDYAQIARNLATGQGFTTKFIKPLSLTRSLHIDRHPDLTYPPLHPGLMALFMSLFEPTAQAAALACGTAFLLTIPLVFIFALRLFDRDAAWLATALYVTNLVAIRFSISGLEVSLLSLLVTGLIMVLYHYAQCRRQQRLWLAISAAVLMGAIYLTKYIWVITIIPVLIYIYYCTPRRRREQILLVFAVTFFVVIAPWCYRMCAVSGNPFFTWRWYEMTMASRTNPANTLYRSFPEQLVALPTYFLHHPNEVYEKVRDGVTKLYTVLAQFAGPYVTPFFFVAILVPLGSREFERMRYLVYAMYGTMVAALLVVVPADRLLHPLAPVATIIAAGFYFRIFRPLIRDMDPRTQMRYTLLAVGALFALHAVPLGLALTTRERSTQEQQQLAQKWSRQAAQLAEGAPIITDIPWAVAWYADTPAIWVPRDFDDLARMQAEVGQLRWLLLTPFVAGTKGVQRTEIWAEAWQAGLRRDPIPVHGFRVHKRIGNGTWILFQQLPSVPAAESTESAE